MHELLQHRLDKLEDNDNCSEKTRRLGDWEEEEPMAARAFVDAESELPRCEDESSGSD